MSGLCATRPPESNLLAVLGVFTFSKSHNSHRRREMIRKIILGADKRTLEVISFRFIVESNVFAKDMHECETLSFNITKNEKIRRHHLSKLFLQNKFFAYAIRFKPRYIVRADDDTYFNATYIHNTLLNAPHSHNVFGKFRHWYSWDTWQMRARCYDYSPKRWERAQQHNGDQDCDSRNISRPFLFADGPLSAFSFEVAKRIVEYAVPQEKHYIWYMTHHNVGRMQSFEDVFYGYLLSQHFKDYNIQMKRLQYKHPLKSGLE